MKRKSSSPRGKEGPKTRASRPSRKLADAPVGKNFPLEPEVMPAEGEKAARSRRATPKSSDYIEAEYTSDEEQAESNEPAEESELSEAEIEAEASQGALT